MQKYFNKRTMIDNIAFSSKKEASRYLELKILLQKNYICDLKLQQKFELQPKFVKNGKKYQSINYVADFTYFDVTKHKYIVEDVKAFCKKKQKFLSTPEYKLKKKLFEFLYPDKEIREV